MICCCSKSYLENQMSVAMGGRVAEELIFGPENVTTGASNDFQQVLAMRLHELDLRSQRAILSM